MNAFYKIKKKSFVKCRIYSRKQNNDENLYPDLIKYFTEY